MMKSIRWLALGAAAVALGACSDSVVSPTTRSPGAVARSATVNTSSITVVSDAASPNPTQFCAGSTQLGVFTTFPAVPALTGCANAVDLQAGAGGGILGVYNPGWDNPAGLTVTTGHWVGFQTATGPSSDYRPTPGLYYYTQSFTVPTGATAPSLTLDVLADNVAAVYLNGTLLGSQTMTDCNAGSCNWQVVNKLTVTAASGLFNPSGTANTLVFVVNDVPTGFPLTSGLGGTPPNYGCTHRDPSDGIAGFSSTVVATKPDHAGPHPTGEVTGILPLPTLDVKNSSTQDGCENPSGLAFAGTVSFTPAPPPPSAIWCSPGFWKNHGLGLWVPLQGLLYNANGPYPNDPQTFVGYKFNKNHVGSENPTLLDVISNPNTYGGPATNNVASFIGLKLFGTPESANPVENCPDPLPPTLPLGPG